MPFRPPATSARWRALAGPPEPRPSERAISTCRHAASAGYSRTRNVPTSGHSDDHFLHRCDPRHISAAPPRAILAPSRSGAAGPGWIRWWTTPGLSSNFERSFGVSTRRRRRSRQSLETAETRWRRLGPSRSLRPRSSVPSHPASETPRTSSARSSRGLASLPGRPGWHLGRRGRRGRARGRAPQRCRCGRGGRP